MLRVAWTAIIGHPFPAWRREGSALMRGERGLPATLSAGTAVVDIAWRMPWAGLRAAFWQRTVFQADWSGASCKEDTKSDRKDDQMENRPAAASSSLCAGFHSVALHGFPQTRNRLRCCIKLYQVAESGASSQEMNLSRLIFPAWPSK